LNAHNDDDCHKKCVEKPFHWIFMRKWVNA